MNLAQEVIDIIATKGMVDRTLLSEEAKLSELNISSLDVVEIIFALEDKFNIQIPYNANSADLPFKTVGELIDAVASLQKQ